MRALFFKKCLPALLAPLLISSSCSSSAPVDTVIVPRPAKIEMLDGSCRAKSEPTVSIVEDFPYGPEAYILEITSDGISIQAGTETGAFYAQQSLKQLREHSGRRIRAQRITDWPRFEYRGVHMDVSRHFFGKEVVKKQLEMFASLKINTLHWHLTDGEGWRIRIDRYPLLHEVAAWRPIADYQQWCDNGRYYCKADHPGAYGGYYTKEDLREIVAFADSLHITVIPEIEMFGHSPEVTAVYPELACGTKECIVHEDGTWERGQGEYCIGKEATFEFLENVLDEVLDIFPSKYIHIGGDEAGKKNWAECPDCRRRMREEHLDGVDGLQSYGISRIERYLNDRGRSIIGWDEILEGGLAPNAVVMSWRGVDGGLKAAAMEHRVIMTPNDYCYLDRVQGNPLTEPEGFGGHIPLSRLYSYDPAPASMEGREYVMGVQANLWTEKVGTPEHLEHMYYPRVFALAEIAWTPQEERDYDDFRSRALLMSRSAVKKGYEVFDISAGDDLRDGYEKGVDHLAKGCKVTYYSTYSPRKYRAAGDSTLTDGQVGGWDFHDRWQGWGDVDCIYVVDLGSVRKIHSISTTFGQWASSGIYIPDEVSYEISDDGNQYERIFVQKRNSADSILPAAFVAYDWRSRKAVKTRYIKVKAIDDRNRGSWLFTDELIVR